jgi:hypothetical protein
MLKDYLANWIGERFAETLETIGEKRKMLDERHIISIFPQSLLSPRVFPLLTNSLFVQNFKKVCNQRLF